MANKVLNTIITSRNDSKTNWQTANPVLLKGEIAIEFDPAHDSNSYTVKMKVGDGVNNYNDLPYVAGEPIALPAPDGTSIVNDNNVWKLAGFDAATADKFPVKRITSNVASVEWVALPSHLADLDTLYSTVTSHVADTSNPHSVTAAQVGALADSTKYGASLTMSIDSSTYVVTATLKDQDGNTLGTAQTIDLPLESVVVSGSYDDQTKKVILTLQSGDTVEFSIADLIDGLQSEITAQNMLDADLVDDSTSTNKFTTAADITKLAGVETGAEVNVLESVSTADGALTITSKGVTIPTATASVQGTVKGSTAGNKVAVGNDGTMEVNSLSTDKLTQGTNTLVLQCGTATT